MLEYMLQSRESSWRFPSTLQTILNLLLINLERSSAKQLRAIFCKSHPTCDSRVFRISSFFNELKIMVILEYGRNFSFIKHFVEFLGGSRDICSFSRNTIGVHKLYFESPLLFCFSEFKLLLH